MRYFGKAETLKPYHHTSVGPSPLYAGVSFKVLSRTLHVLKVLTTAITTPTVEHWKAHHKHLCAEGVSQLAASEEQQRSASHPSAPTG